MIRLTRVLIFVCLSVCPPNHQPVQVISWWNLVILFFIWRRSILQMSGIEPSSGPTSEVKLKYLMYILFEQLNYKLQFVTGFLKTCRFLVFINNVWKWINHFLSHYIFPFEHHHNMHFIINDSTISERNLAYISNRIEPSVKNLFN